MAAGQIPGGWNATSDWEHVGQPWIGEAAGGPTWYAMNKSYSEAAPGGGVYWVEQYEPEGPTSNPAVGTYWRRILMEQQPASQQQPPPVVVTGHRRSQMATASPRDRQLQQRPLAAPTRTGFGIASPKPSRLA